jgi:hypothetical protein
VKRKRFWIPVLAAVASGALGQETRSTIQGRVLDPNAAAVPGAKVAVVNRDTNVTVNLVTNETGYYEARFLMPGNYRIAAEAPGFKRTVREGVVLPIASQIQLDVTLEIGELTESIAVTAEASLLDVQAATAGKVLDNVSLTQLPLFSANPTSFVRFTPGIQSGLSNPQSVALFANSASSDYGAPGQVGTNSWTIDGAPNEGLDRRIAAIPNTETIQEMKVEAANFDASHGHSTGVSVSMMTKSGTNSLRGMANWFHRQQRWRAVDYFAREFRHQQINALAAQGRTAEAEALRKLPILPPGRNNGYAATLGGPVVLPRLYDGRNRTFFHFSLDGYLERGTKDALYTIPTMANRQGDFSQLLNVDPVRYQIYDPLSVAPDPERPSFFIRQPLPGNVVPGSRFINPTYKHYLRFLPEPNNDPTDPTREPIQNYRAVGMPNNSNYYGASNRVDHRFSDRHQFYARWSWTDYHEDKEDWTYTVLRGLRSTDYIRKSRSGTADWVWVYSPSTVYHLAVAGNEFRQGNLFTVPRQFKPSDFGFPKYMDEKVGDRTTWPSINISGYEGFGNSYPTLTRVSTLTLKTDISQVRGAHSWKAGLDLRTHRRNGGGSGRLSGLYTFTNSYTRRNSDTLTPAGNLGHSWAAFAMGIPSAASTDIVDDYALSSPYYGLFVQDSWRITPRLTLNLGLRMEHEFGTVERYDRMLAGFDPAAKLPITDLAQAAYQRNPVPELAPSAFTVVGGSLYANVGGTPRNLVNSQIMWLPRLSGAWQPARRWVVRSGFGVYYDTFNPLFHGIDQTGFSRTTNTPIEIDAGSTWLAGDPRNGVSMLNDPFPVRADGTRFDEPLRTALGLMARAGRGWSFQNYNLRRARVQRFRLGLQRELTRNLGVEVAYSAARSTDIGLSRTLSALPEFYWADGLTRRNDIATNLSANVTNPFAITNFAPLASSSPLVYRELSNLSYFINPRISKHQLLRPFPHMNGLTQNNVPNGKSRADYLELSVDRRFSKGLSFSLAYTRLWQKDADFYANEFDPVPTWRPSNSGRPHRLGITGLYALPFGAGKPLANSGLWKALLGGWQCAFTYEYQPGPMLQWGNLFYYGDLNKIALPNPTINAWFDTSNFEKVAARGPAAFHRRVFPTVLDSVRRDKDNWWNGNISRIFKIRERMSLQFRADVMNLANRNGWGSPDVNPYSSNFGRVTSSNGSMRQLQVYMKLSF